MPIYEYKAFNPSGKNVSGIVDADSAKSARAKLRQSGILVTTLKEEHSRKNVKTGGSFAINIFPKVKTQDISIMTSQLSTLIGAGLPLVGALNVLSEQTENTYLQKIVTNVREMVNEGTSFADALGNYPKYFSHIFISMIRAGESSGTLDTVMVRLSDFLEKQLALRNKVKAALTYPVFMMVIGALIVFILLTYLVPTITAMFTERNVALPLPTIILIFISDALKNFWWLLIGLIILVVLLFKKYISTDRGHHMFDRLKLKIPKLGTLIKKSAISRFTQTLGVLLKSGIPILNAMNIVEAIVNNVVIADAIRFTKDNIKEGEDIASQLKLCKVFPPLVIHMISVGEKSGHLEDMLLKVSEAYDNEVENAIQGLTSLIEPLMIVVMAVVVCFIVIAILLPMLEMNKLIG